MCSMEIAIRNMIFRKKKWVDYKKLHIDGADKIENVWSMEIVIGNMIFWKKKWVDYKNYT